MAKKHSSGNAIGNAITIAHRIISFLIIYTERSFRNLWNNGRWVIRTAPLAHTNLTTLYTSTTGGTVNGRVIAINLVVVIILYLVVSIALIIWSFIRAIAPH
ncbi:MAG: hypothetical protein NTZ44_03000 [Candidatus Nomurabacteria bacterium]|nr:hypothetical protein [Candidatus Nomurabacteria bacterium]